MKSRANPCRRSRSASNSTVEGSLQWRSSSTRTRGSCALRTSRASASSRSMRSRVVLANKRWNPSRSAAGTSARSVSATSVRIRLRLWSRLLCPAPGQVGPALPTLVNKLANAVLFNTLSPCDPHCGVAVQSRHKGISESRFANAWLTTTKDRLSYTGKGRAPSDLEYVSSGSPSHHTGDWGLGARCWGKYGLRTGDSPGGRGRADADQQVAWWGCHLSSVPPRRLGQ